MKMVLKANYVLCHFIWLIKKRTWKTFEMQFITLCSFTVEFIWTIRTIFSSITFPIYRNAFVICSAPGNKNINRLQKLTKYYVSHNPNYLQLNHNAFKFIINNKIRPFTIICQVKTTVGTYYKKVTLQIIYCGHYYVKLYKISECVSQTVKQVRLNSILKK